jgi:hypothetical protein
MSEWWTYTLSDFLMFSPRVYYRLFVLQNEALWPTQFVAIALGVAIAVMLVRPVRGSGRLIPVILGAQWIWIAWAFFWESYASVNWASRYVAPFFVLEGLLLIAAGAAGQGLSFARPRGAVALAGLALFAVALVLYPLIPLLMQRPWQAAEIFGIAPDPTVIATLAVLALAGGALRFLLMIIPAAWCVITGATLWTMSAGDFFVAPAAALTAIVVTILSWRSRKPAAVRCTSR